MKISRREFGKKIVSATVGIGTSLTFPALLQTEPQLSSTVAICRSDQLHRIKDRVDPEKAFDLINRGLLAITRQSEPQEAWEALFKPEETVGIKLSCLAGPKLSSSTGVVAALVQGLKLAGVSESRIIIWERTNRELKNAGFDLTHRGPIVAGTDDPRFNGYSETVSISGSVGTCFSRILEQVDSLINVPVLKDHDIAGLSCGLKNFYGAIHNPNKYHANACNPFAAEISAHPLIKNKLRLVVCDATRIQFHNGPAYSPAQARDEGMLLIGDDPVAVDLLGWKYIEKWRAEQSLPTLAESGREPKYIFSASRMNLGRADERAIKKVWLT